MLKIVVVLFVVFCFVESQQLHDPDSWRQSGPVGGNVHHSPDIVFEHTPSKLENVQNDSVSWFYKKLVMIILKKGIKKENEDKTLDVTLHFKFSEEQWQTLFEIASSHDVLTDAKLRRSDGYISEAVYSAPYLVELASTWAQATLEFLTNNKMLILGTLLILLVMSIVTIAVKHFSFRAVAFTTFLLIIYAWETLIVYKEYEQQEYKKLVSAIFYCQWKFWSSKCDHPMPDDLQFYRYMNPVKIIPRIVTQMFTEPLIYCCATMEDLCNILTRDLMWPLSVIVHYGLLVMFAVIILQMFFLVFCNFILNIPCSSSFLYIFNVSFGQRNRSFNVKSNVNANITNSNKDQISGENVEKLLSITNLVLSQQVNLQQQINNSQRSIPVKPSTSSKLKKSSSAGRLCITVDDNNFIEELSPSTAYKRNKTKLEIGDGDNHL